MAELKPYDWTGATRSILEAQRRDARVAPEPTEEEEEQSAAPLAPTDAPAPTESQARTEPEEEREEEREPFPTSRVTGEKWGPIDEGVEMPAGISYPLWWSEGGAKRMAETKDPTEKYLLAEQAQPGEQLMDPKRLDIAAEPEPLGSAWSVLHSLDIPRTVAWLAAYTSEGLLPDPTAEGEEPTITSKLGDVSEWATGKVVGSYLSYRYVDPIVEEGESDPFEVIGNRLYDAVASGRLLEKGLQRKIAMFSGEGGLPFVDLIGEEGIEVPYPKGIDVINEAIPIEVAQRIAAVQSLSDPKSKMVWEMLSRPGGREAMGVAMEVALDPLWLAGAAGGTVKVVSKYKSIEYAVAAPIVKSAGVVQDLLKIGHKEVLGGIVDMVEGSATAKKTTTDLFKLANELAGIRVDDAVNRLKRLARGLEDPARAAKEATDEANRAARELDDLIANYKVEGISAKVEIAQKAKADLAEKAARFGSSPKSAQKYLEQQYKVAKRELKIYENQHVDLYHGQSLLADGVKHGMIKEKGRLAVHIPMGTKTYYPGTSAAKVVGYVMPQALIRQTQKIKNYMEPFDRATLTKLSKEAPETMNRAQSLAFMLTEYTTKGLAIPAGGLDILAMMFGTRFYQPLLGRYRATAEIAQYSTRRKGMLGVPVIGDRWVFAQKVAPKQWEALQEAIEGFNRSVVTRDAELTQRTKRWGDSAARALVERKAEAKANIKRINSEHNRLTAAVKSARGEDRVRLLAELAEIEAQQVKYRSWLNKEYNMNSVQAESVEEFESGSRVAREKPHIMRVQGGVEKVVESIVEDYHKILGDDYDKVRQAIFNLQAKMIGSVEQKDLLLKSMDEVKDAYLATQGNLSRLHTEATAIAKALRTRTGAMRILVQKVGADDLAKALERVRLGVGGKGYDSLIHEQFVENILMDVFRDARVVDEVLNKAATLMNESDRAAAVVALVRKLSTKLAKGEVSASKILGDSIKQTLNEMLKHDDLIHKASIGDFTKKEEVEVMTMLLGAQFGIHINKMKGTIGDDLLPHFIKWADEGDFKKGWTKRFEQSLRDQGVHPSQRPPKEAPTTTAQMAAGDEVSVGMGKMGAEDLQEQLANLESGKSIAALLMTHAEEPSYRKIASRILPFLDETRVHVVREGPGVPVKPPVWLDPNNRAHVGIWNSVLSGGARGGAISGEAHTGAYIVLRGTGFGSSGVNATTVLHELIHAATQRRIHDAQFVKNQGTTLSKAWNELNNLTGQIIQESKKLERTGKGWPGPARINNDEVIAWGLTDKSYQDFLKTIKLGKRSAFNRFVDGIANLLGIPPKERNALSEVIRLTDDILRAPLDELPFRRLTKTGEDGASVVAKMERGRSIFPSPGSLGKALNEYKKARALGEAVHNLGQAGATAKARGIEGGLIKLTKRGAISPVSKELGKTGMLTRRLELLIGDVKSPEEAVAKVRAALEDMLPSSEKYEQMILDEMAGRIGRDVFKRVRVSPGRVGYDPDRELALAEKELSRLYSEQTKIDQQALRGGWEPSALSKAQDGIDDAIEKAISKIASKRKKHGTPDALTAVDDDIQKLLREHDQLVARNATPDQLKRQDAAVDKAMAKKEQLVDKILKESRPVRAKEPGLPAGAIDDLATPERAVKDAKAKALELLRDENKKIEARLKGKKGDLAVQLRAARDERKRLMKELKKESEIAQPRIKPWTGPIRNFEPWEEEAMRRFHQLPGVQNFNDEDLLYAAATGLKRMGNLVDKDVEWVNNILKMYPKAVGTRLMDETKDLERVIDEFSGLAKSYEEAYKKAGWNFMKSSEDMLRDWGVLEFVPHPLDQNTATALGKSDKAISMAAEATPHIDPGGSASIDGRLSVTMDATKKRVIAGTIKEINAHTDGVNILIDPLVIIGRYMQSNKALSASEMLYMLKSGDVIRAIKSQPGPGGHASEIAARLDYVPLFNKPSAKRDYELLLAGDSKAWDDADVSVDEIYEAVSWLKSYIQGAKKGHKAKDSPVASIFGTVPEIRTMLNAKLSVLTIRQHQWSAMDFDKLTPLLDPAKRYAAVMVAPKHQARITNSVIAARKKATVHAKRKGFSQTERLSYVANKVEEARVMEPWNIVADAVNQIKVQRKLSAPNVTGHGLAMTYGTATEPAAWALYVPRGVVTALGRTLDLKSVKGEGAVVKKALDKINNYWKARVTIIAIAFHARNDLSNKFSNILDVGIFGALDPSTNFMASKLSHAVYFYEKYGSLAKAKEILTAPKGTYESLSSWALRQSDRVSFSTISSWADETIDIGDGVGRKADDVLEYMRNKGITSGSGTQYVDMNKWETDTMEVLTNNIGGKMYTAKKVASMLEDIAIVGGPMLITGGIPISLPKGAGAALGRYIENQARATNFIANLKRGGNMDEAATHAAKFLFDYGDLTAFQKVWMRTLFPFFTWNMKNVHLNMEMMTTSPMFYSMMNHAFIDGIPRALMSIDDGEPVHGLPTRQEQRQKMSHVQSLIRMPLPQSFGVPKGVFIEGFGLPIEGFTEMLGLGSSIANTGMIHPDAWDRRPGMRVFGMLHPVARFLGEYIAKRHFHYDRPIKELTSGQQFEEVISAVRKVDPSAAQLLKMQAEFAYIPVTTHSGKLKHVPVVNGYSNWALGHFPYSRIIRQATSLSNSTAQTMAYSHQESAEIEYKEVPFLLRLLRAWTGIRVVQVSEGMEARVYESRKEKAYDEYLKSRKSVIETKRIHPTR